jgi:DNA-directed RNA polymerase
MLSTQPQTLRSAQLALEQAMADEAHQRQQDDNLKTSKRGAWAESKTGTIYQHSLTKGFTEAVRERLAQVGQPGPRVKAYSMLAKSHIEPEVIAHLTIRAILNCVPIRGNRPMLRVSLCSKIGDLIHDEVRIRFFAQGEERRKLLKKLFATFDKRTYPRHWRKRTIKNYFHAEQIEWEGWTNKERILAGYALLLLFRDSTGLIEAPSNSPYVNLTTEFTAHIETTMAKRVLDYTLYKPMVVKPKPWSMENLFRGGYISNTVKPYPLVKRTRRSDIAGMLERDWSKIIPAVNALQETPFRVNKTVLDALAWAYAQRGGGVAGLPLANDKPLPPQPEGFGTDPDVTKAHNLVCFNIHSENRETKSKRQAVLRTIGLAQKFKGFDAIYFPHNLDSRGRAYPLPAYLNPQGPDYVKGLLEFGIGHAIYNDEQACWLAIACANAYGNDKVSLQERADWTVDNEALILSIANDPYSDVRWTEASEPFQFLRCCIEWRDFQATGFGFVSHLVIPVDATCSGLQHYSAMLRDDVGGRSVNLIPGLPRQDIYRDVADLTNTKLMETQGEARALAGNLLAVGIDRKITKRQVMVVPYAGTYLACMKYTRESLKSERWDAGVPLPWEPNDSEAANQHIALLSKYIWESITDTVVKAREAMTWLTGAARAYVKVANKLGGKARERAMRWNTPDGFHVTHYAVDLRKSRVDTYLDGRVQLVVYEETDRLSAQDMAQAVAPNFVHSLDACLLRMATMRALKLDRPITSFCMIHDSFGVHASRMSEFQAECIRPAFVEMYQQDVLAEFRRSLLASVPTGGLSMSAAGLGLDRLPDQGKLDLDGVLTSEFFFS